MNGPEHYREAERLLASKGYVRSDTIAEAQVHATLALAAAVGGLDAVEGPSGGSATGRMSGDSARWLSIVDPLPPAREGRDESEPAGNPLPPDVGGFSVGRDGAR